MSHQGEEISSVWGSDGGNWKKYRVNWKKDDTVTVSNVPEATHAPLIPAISRKQLVPHKTTAQNHHPNQIHSSGTSWC